MVGPKFSGLTYTKAAPNGKSWEVYTVYSAIYGEVNVSVCAEMKGDYIEK
jgi:hypothetical protein